MEKKILIIVSDAPALRRLYNKKQLTALRMSAASLSKFICPACAGLFYVFSAFAHALSFITYKVTVLL